MAQRGRKPKPSALKELEGNPGKREINTNEPHPVKKRRHAPNGLNLMRKKNGADLQSRWNSLEY